MFGDAPPPHFRKQEIPADFLTSAHVLNECELLMQELLNHSMSQDAIDNAYTNFSNIYMTEMRKYLREISNTPKPKSSLKIN